MNLIWLETKRHGNPEGRNRARKDRGMGKHRTRALGELVRLEHPRAMGLVGNKAVFEDWNQISKGLEGQAEESGPHFLINWNSSIPRFHPRTESDYLT